LLAIFQQTQATEKAANAAATAANIANNTLTQTEAEATAESTDFNRQLSKLNDSINAANRLADASNRQADASDRQADASGQQARVAAGNLAEARRQLASSQREFVIAQRPWVGEVADARMGWDAKQQRIVGHATVKNSGRSPANHVVILGRFFFGAPAMPQIDAFFKNLPLKPIPGGQSQIFCREITAATPWVRAAPKIFTTAPRRPTHRHMSPSRVWYQDDFKRWYSTDYCATWYETYDSWTECLRHNEEHEPTK
jgi:hypothetical protein